MKKSKRIFIDEAGDRGFVSKASKYFVLTAMVCDDDSANFLPFFSLLEEERSTNPKIYPTSFHAGKDDHDMRVKTLDLLLSNKDKFHFYSVSVEKSIIYPINQNESFLYHQCTETLLKYIFQSFVWHGISDVHICFDRIQEENRRRKIHSSLKKGIGNLADSKRLLCNTHFTSSAGTMGLQIVDYACWLNYRRLTHGIDDFYVRNYFSHLGMNPYELFKK